MHKVGTQAHTPHGIGEITEAETVRGRTTYRVAGRGFNVYIEASKLQVASNSYLSGLESTIDPGHPYHVNKDNSTTLPYDPTPQHPVDIFRGEQTIKPGEFETDADDRLRSSDSLTKNKAKDNRPYPGPNPDLFAKNAADHRDPDELPEYDPDEDEEEGWLDLYNKDPGAARKGIGAEPGGKGGYYDRSKAWNPHHGRSEYDGPEPGDDPYYEQHSADLAHESEQDEHAARGGGWPHHGAFEDGPSQPEWGDDEWHEGLPDVEHTARMHEDPMHSQYGLGSPGLTHPAELEYDDPNDPNSVATLKRQEGTSYHPGEGRHYRPAGISDRYAFILESDDHSDVGQFRRDPLDYMQRQAHVMIAGEEDHLFQKFADYDNLLDVDPHMREAAWKDVAAKAKRLRAEGAVHPEDIGPNRIMATVDGDNGTYKTLVLRGPGYAGIGKGANSATFSCSCMWGKWAFKRQYTFVGRMCSHALASLWELQSHSSKGNKGKFKAASVVDDFKKWAKDNNDGHMDQSSISDFANTADDKLSRDDVQKLYDYLADNHQEAPERDYDIDYTLDNDKAYKTADVLRTQPQSLTPDLRMVPQNDEHEWTDVTEDDRKTTGPDQIVHFSTIMAALHPRVARPTPSDELGGIEEFLNDIPQPRPTVAPPEGYAPTLPGLAKGIWHNFVGGPGDAGGGGNVPQPAVQPPAPPAPDTHTLGDAGALHPPAPGQGAPANAAAANQHVPAGPAPGPVAPGNIAPPPGGSSATGNPIQAPSSGDSTGAGRSGPADPNGTPGGGSAIGQGTTYHVNQGDTLSDIAQRAGLGKDQYQQIADANGIKDVNHIETGQDLKIPGQSGSGTPGQGESVTHGAPDASTPPASPSGLPAPPKPGDDSALAAGLGQKPNTPGTPPPPTPAAGLPPGGSIAPPQPGGPSVGVQPSPTSAPIDNKPFKPQASRRYAESSDAGLLDKLRELSHEPASDSLQHMDSRNDELRDVVEELQDRGVDASFMVASLHQADSPADGNPDFLGISSPGWADEPFQGSGPSPRDYISDSQSYLDSHEPDLHDVTDGEDIIKFNDSRSRPQQGPRHSSNGVKRAGGGPQRGIRVDPGARQGGAPKNPLRHAQGTMPGDEDMTALPPADAPDPLASSGNDLVANFQRSAAAQDLWSDNSSGSGGMYSDDAIAANAQAMMRTAGRKFTQAEQRELEEEAHILGARNMPNESDLAGTHYLMGL